MDFKQKSCMIFRMAINFIKNCQLPLKIDMFLLFIVLVGLAGIAVSTFSLPMPVVVNDWVALQQSVFQATLLFSYFCLFRFINSYRGLWISIVLGLILQETLFFDQIMHPFLVSSRFYEIIGKAHYAGNPQYAKLILFIPSLILNIVFFMKNRTERINQSLKIIYIIIVLGVVYLNHFLFPSGLMRETFEQRIKFLSRVEIYNKFELRSFCIHINARCRVLGDEGFEILHDPYFNFESEKVQQLFKYSEALTNKQETVFLETNQLLGIYLVKKKADGSFVEIFDHDFVKYFWNLNLGYFSLACFLVTFLWQIFLFVLFFLHSKRVTI